MFVRPLGTLSRLVDRFLWGGSPGGGSRRRGDLKGYSPPPGGFIVGPACGYQRRDQHYQPTHRGPSAARVHEP